MGPLLNEVGHLVIQGMEKTEVLNVFLSLFLLARLTFRSHGPQKPGGRIEQGKHTLSGRGQGICEQSGHI